MPTVAVVIIGDEILTGKFADENGPFLIRRLRALGADLQRLVTIRDGVERIAEEVRAAAAGHDWVLTTGGVGPTHDDLTFEGVARAFEIPLEQRAELIARMLAYRMELNPMTLRMATLPQGAELVGLEQGHYPAVRVRNVFIFPGVPRLLQQKFELIAARLAGAVVATARIYADDPEHEIAVHLDVVARAHPRVQIGSYPRYDEETGRLIITFEGPDQADVQQAVAAVAAGLRVRRVEGPG